MAAETTYFEVAYDTLASGPFVELDSTNLLTWPGATGFVISLLVDSVVATEGKLKVALLTGALPTTGQTLTQNTTTASTIGPSAAGGAVLSLYPCYFRRDVTLSAAGAYAWDGEALQVTHSFLFDGGGTAAVPGEILTFVDGQVCECISILSNELRVRWITPIDTQGFPEDNDSFTGDVAATGDALNGLVHDRSYSALHLHRISSDLNDDPFYTGDDISYSTKPIPSGKDTDAIINLLGAVVITEVISKHMYGGSVKQGSGSTEELFSGLNIQVTDSDGDTEPVLIKDDVRETAWWANTLNPNSIQGGVRILVKTREDGCDFDGKRVKGRLLRFGDTYFTGSTTLGTATTALALFSTPDGNNDTALVTVQAYSIGTTQGYQLIDFNNGAGSNPYALSHDFSTQTSKETYEKTKADQYEGTAQTLFGRDARLFDGITLDFHYDGAGGAGFNEGATAEKLAWGFEIAYGTLAGGTFTIGNVLIQAVTGARGRILYDDGVDFCIVALEGTTAFDGTNNLVEWSAGSTTGVTATATGVVVNSAAGTALICADDGTDDIYLQRLTGVVPVDNQTCFGVTTDSYCDVDAATSQRSRVVNNQYVGVYTGTNYQTNFGVAIDDDGIAGDKFPDMAVPSVIQEPPDNRTSTIEGLEADFFIQCLPWDGTSYDLVGDPEPNFDELAVATANIVAASSTTVQVAAIPDNTPTAGFLIIEINTTGEYGFWEYTSITGTTTFNMVGTAPFNANIGNDVMRAPIYEIAGGTSVNFTAVLGTPNQWLIVAKRGGTTTPIKPAKATATFPFEVTLQAQSDA